MGKSEDGTEKSGITRAELLKAAAVATPAFLLGRPADAAAAGPRPRSRRGPAGDGIAGMNVLLFLTDQQRAIQHFPVGWSRRNMPGMTRLHKHGMLFRNAFTNACMCSPARSTLMSGYFPAQHGVKYTLEIDMPAPQYPQVELDTSFKNPATVALAAGYLPVYKGKFHCNKPANGSTWVPSDVNKYGFTRWDPPDAGAGDEASSHRDRLRPMREIAGRLGALVAARLAGAPLDARPPAVVRGRVDRVELGPPVPTELGHPASDLHPSRPDRKRWHRRVLGVGRCLVGGEQV